VAAAAPAPCYHPPLPLVMASDDLGSVLGVDLSVLGVDLMGLGLRTGSLTMQWPLFAMADAQFRFLPSLVAVIVVSLLPRVAICIV